jgi:serine/threonine protein kinase
MVMRLFARDTLYSPGQKIGNYTVEQVSGEGRYGICYLVSDERQHYILKQLKRFVLKRSKAKAGYEQEVLSSLEHKSIPRFIRRIENEDLCGYLLEYKEGKTFEDLIHSEDRIFSACEIRNIGMQLVGILKYLHQSGIVHRDIRIPNTLYNNHKVYLVDFGLARPVDERKYRPDVDFAYLGDFLLHLYYTSHEMKGKKTPWYEELSLRKEEMLFLKKLLGIDRRYRDIYEVEFDLLTIIGNGDDDDEKAKVSC